MRVEPSTLLCDKLICMGFTFFWSPSLKSRLASSMLPWLQSSLILQIRKETKVLSLWDSALKTARLFSSIAISAAVWTLVMSTKDTINWTRSLKWSIKVSEALSIMDTRSRTIAWKYCSAIWISESTCRRQRQRTWLSRRITRHWWQKMNCTSVVWKAMFSRRTRKDNSFSIQLTSLIRALKSMTQGRKSESQPGRTESSSRKLTRRQWLWSSTQTSQMWQFPTTNQFTLTSGSKSIR